MKKIFIFLILAISLNFTYAQNINWQSIDDNQRSLVYLNVGYDFGMTTQIGYAYKMNAFKPLFLTADFSVPMGNQLLDDHKVRLGGQISAFQKSNFILTVKAFGVFRRHQTRLVRMASFGSELSALAGFYKPKWHAAFEFGFDKSITTHLKHTDTMRENFPTITDGWFIPTGGHFFYGIQGSKTIKTRLELSLRAGVTNAQFDDKNALLPYYAQLGFIWKIK